jgi:hypothetical protein
MNRDHNFKITLLISLVAFFSSFAQNNTEYLGETSVGIKHKLSKKYSFNFTLRSRYFLYQDASWLYNQQQVDIYHFSTLKLSNKHKLSLGLYYRNRAFFEAGSGEIRITERFSFEQKHPRILYSHKIRLEQRFLNTLTIFRQRYKFGVNFPLNRKTYNTGKTFLLANLESLVSFSSALPPITDLRTTAQFGWKATKNLVIKTGLEHRLEAYNLRGYNLFFLLTSANLRI